MKGIPQALFLPPSGRMILAHLAPYPAPDILAQDLPALLEQVKFADRLFFGGWNDHPRVSRYPRRRAIYT